MDEGGEGRGQRGDILYHLFVLLLRTTTSNYVQTGIQPRSNNELVPVTSSDI